MLLQNQAWMDCISLNISLFDLMSRLVANFNAERFRQDLVDPLKKLSLSAW